MRQSIKHLQEPALYLRLLVTKQAELLSERRGKHENFEGAQDQVLADDRPAAGRASVLESSDLSRVNTALEKLRNGRYGACEGCGSSIPATRLNAVPWAERCHNCEGKGFRH